MSAVYDKFRVISMVYEHDVTFDTIGAAQADAAALLAANTPAENDPVDIRIQHIEINLDEEAAWTGSAWEMVAQ